MWDAPLGLPGGAALPLTAAGRKRAGVCKADRGRHAARHRSGGALMAEPRLGEQALAGLPTTVARPAYDRRSVSRGIVHLGLGAFHRAHQAVYTDDRLAAGESAWGIVGMSLRSPDVRNALAPQDALYTVLQRGPDGDRARIIGSVLDVITGPDDPDG